MRQLVLTQEQQIAIDDLSRARSDGGLGVIFDGIYYRCDDVRGDPKYSEYQSIIANCRTYCEPIAAWQGRYILAGMTPITAGALFAYSGANVLEQVVAFVEANFSAQEKERFKGALTWRRDDPMIASFSELLGLDDAAIDAWFALARNIV